MKKSGKKTVAIVGITKKKKVLSYHCISKNTSSPCKITDTVDKVCHLAHESSSCIFNSHCFPINSRLAGSEHVQRNVICIPEKDGCFQK